MDIYERLREEKTIVGFSGKKRCGKDTAGDALASMGYETVSLASPIKKSAKYVFQFTESHVNGSKKGEFDEFWGFTPRWAMQMIGTELFRDQIDEDVWIKSLLARIDESNLDKFAITDVRFPNEIEHIHRAGGEVVYIRRPENHPEYDSFKKWIAKQGGFVRGVASFFTDFEAKYHWSELALDDHPVSQVPDLLNDADKASYERAARAYVEALEDGDAFENPPLRASSFS